VRQIVLDTETTGLEPSAGHRIIEIGCVELVDRRRSERFFHQYLQPDRDIDSDAVDVHGITNEFLADKPRFADIAEDFLEFIRGAELVIHNAPFDVGFLNHELALWKGDGQKIESYCRILDTLVLARELHPGQRNSLDALCKRYEVDNSHRDRHGALLDAEILADVYLRMTGGQVTLVLDADPGQNAAGGPVQRLRPTDREPLPVVVATEQEREEHERYLANMEAQLGGTASLWRRWEAAEPAAAAPDRS